MKTTQRVTLCLAAFCLFAIAAFQRADDPPPEQGVDVLTRGPIHEAYASAVAAQPEAGPLVPKPPPNAIEELPPDQKPEGDNVQWMPGYWSWDEERGDYIWVSGFWRVPPPGRQWVPGTWHESNGHQWQYTSGFWTELNQPDMNYLPPPPKPIDSGPPTPAPAADSQYAPGSWVYRDTRYVWRPGFWYPYRANWIYIPAHYSWTPYGYVFVDGYWDYPLRQRGILFAPVAFNVAVYSQPAFVYRPSYVVYDDFLYGALFVRPGVGYVFGDYFEPRYANLGYRSWFSVQIGVGAYDPLFSYYRTSNGRNWAVGINNLYVQRVNNVDYRPPRTLVQQNVVVNNITNNTIVNNNTTVVNNVKNVTAVAAITNVNKTQVVNLTKVTPAQQQAAVEHAREIRQVAVQRAKIEAPPAAAGGVKPAAMTQPRTVKLDLPKAPASPLPSAAAPPPLPIKAEKPAVVTQPPPKPGQPTTPTIPSSPSPAPPPAPKPGDKPLPTPPSPGPKPGDKPPPSTPPPAPKPGDKPPSTPPPPPKSDKPPPPPAPATKGPPPPPANNPPPLPPKSDKPPPPANNPPPPPPKSDKPPPAANNPPPPPPKSDKPPPPPAPATKGPPPPPPKTPPPPPKSDKPPPKDKDKDRPPPY